MKRMFFMLIFFIISVFIIGCDSDPYAGRKNVFTQKCDSTN